MTTAYRDVLIPILRRHAHGADHVIVCNRIKPHTQFVGQIESGLLKMLLIGLGKLDGATVYHRAIKDFSFAQILRSVSDPKTTKLGTGRFWIIEVEIENQKGELCAVDSYTGFGYQKGGE